MASIFSRRIIAFILDFFVVSAIMWIAAFVLSSIFNPFEFYDIYKYAVYVVPILIIVYFTLCEGIKGASVGKAAMRIEVLDELGYSVTFFQAFLRNLTKIFWVPIIFDWALGHILGKGDRLFDIISHTKVIEAYNY